MHDATTWNNLGNIVLKGIVNHERPHVVLYEFYHNVYYPE